tara:strand:+ start:3846 stop:4118 length:273 start_codon:yes stop_codon:yes gene_type:complete
MTPVQLEKYNEYVAKMWKIIHEYELLFEKAPVKRGWNQTFRTQIPSQSDVNRKRDAILANINDNCVRMTGKDLITFDAEVYESKLTVVAQ